MKRRLGRKCGAQRGQKGPTKRNGAHRRFTSIRGETIRALLDRLGDPQDRLPPVFHVAGTNGKGSTCAFLRAAMEADGVAPNPVTYNVAIAACGHFRLVRQREPSRSSQNTVFGL